MLVSHSVFLLLTWTLTSLSGITCQEQCESKTQASQECILTNFGTCGSSCITFISGLSQNSTGCDTTLNTFCGLIECCEACATESTAALDCVLALEGLNCDKTCDSISTDDDNDDVSGECGSEEQAYQNCLFQNYLACGASCSKVIGSVTAGDSSCEAAVESFCALIGCCDACTTETTALRDCTLTSGGYDCDTTCDSTGDGDTNADNGGVQDGADLDWTSVLQACNESFLKASVCAEANYNPCETCGDSLESTEDVLSCTDINAAIPVVDNGCCGACEDDVLELLECLSKASRCTTDLSPAPDSGSFDMAVVLSDFVTIATAAVLYLVI